MTAVKLAERPVDQVDGPDRNDTSGRPVREGCLRQEIGDADGGRCSERGDGRAGAELVRYFAVALLCSPDAGWVTGQLLHADGGANLVDTLMPLDIQRAERG